MIFRKAVYILLSLVFALHGYIHAQVRDTSALSLQDTAALLPDTIKHAQIDTTAGLKQDTVAVHKTDSLPQSTNQHRNAPATSGNINGYEVKGKIRDANTGEGIPFAIVFFPHTSVGVSADLDGNFDLKFDKAPNDTLRVTAIGYTVYNKRFDKGSHSQQTIIEMERATNQLNEVVVHAGEDPAIVLMKNIIRRKPYNNPDRIENYGYQAYNKLEADLERLSRAQFEKIPLLKKFGFIYDNVDTVSEAKPFLPLYLTETLSDYYYRSKPKKEREFIKASMVKGIKNEGITKLLGSLYQNVNSYDNFLPVFDKKFVSPISNSGLFYYKYKIKDTEEVYGHKVILVQFEPRRTGENCFYGDFWVVDSVYALQRISMEVPKLANVNYVNRISLYQEYAIVQDSFWFCIKDKFVADFTAPYGLKIPGFIGRKTTSYSKIMVNDTAVANVLDDKKYKEDVIVADSARKYSDADWAGMRPDTLSKNEKAIYKMVDTIQQMPLFKAYKNIFKLLFIGTVDVGSLQFGPYWYIYSTNPVEGNRFRFSMGTSPDFSKNLHLTGYLAYGEKDDKFKYQFTGLWLLNRKPRMYLYGAKTYDIDHSTNYYAEVGTADNIFSYLFRKPGVPWKLAFSDEDRLEFYKEYFSGFSHKLTLQHKEFTPFAPLPSAGLFHDMNGEETNSVISSEASIRLRWAYKEKFIEGNYLRVSLGSKYPILQLDVSAGGKGILNSGYDYQKARFTVSNTVPIAPFGSLYYNLFAGKVFNTLPYPLLEIHPGNEYYYYNRFAFEMMNKYEFISDQYAGFSIEHNIGGGIFNYIPLLRRAKLRQFWTAKGVVGSLSDANKQLNLNKGYDFRTLEGNPYIELGTGIENILEIFRIDFVWRVTPAPLPTEDRGRYFGIFGSVKFQF